MFYIINTRDAPNKPPMFSEHLEPLLELAKGADLAVFEQLSNLRPGDIFECVLCERWFRVTCRKGNVDEVKHWILRRRLSIE